MFDNFKWINKGEINVKASHDFKETYDSASVMVMQDMDNWAKCCFELTDFGTHAAVSVVTKDAESVKVGLLAQAPTGQGGDRIYENLSIESKTVKNIRAGE